MHTPRFDIGAPVVVVSLGRKTGIVQAIARNGTYRVLVGGLSMACRETDLAEAEPPSKVKRRTRPEVLPPRDDAATPPSPRIDLHGMTVEQAVGVVLTAVDNALRDGAERLEIVHGKGTGRLKSAVERELARISAVRAVRRDARNPGVTWAYF